MKFLCVPCDSPMKLHAIGPPDGGSLSVVYSCPECGYEMAMLTNPFETQLVQSLGVRIGPESGGSTVAGASARPSAGQDMESSTTASGKCPFPGMVGAVEGALGGKAHVQPRSGGRRPPKRGSRTFPPCSSDGEDRHREIRAREGTLEVDETLLDQARDFFGM